jgi:hypothetical protein
MWSSLGNVTFTGPWVVAPCTKLHVVTTQKNIILNIQAIRLMSVTNCEYRFFFFFNEGRTEGVVEITPPAPIRLQWNLEPPCFAAIEVSYQVRWRIWTVNEANFLDLELRHYFLLKHSVGKIKQCHWCMGDRFWQGKTKVLVKNRPHCLFAYQKSYMNWPGIEPLPPGWEASDKPPEPILRLSQQVCHDVTLYDAGHTSWSAAL